MCLCVQALDVSLKLSDLELSDVSMGQCQGMGVELQPMINCNH